MSIKLLLLKSGEDVIADIKEMCVGDKEKPTVVGYFLRYPCRVKLVGQETGQDGDKKHPFRMQLTPWMPLSKDEMIPVVADWVVTATQPIDELKEAYEKGVKRNEDRESQVTVIDGSEISPDSD
tara:strand:+ start:1440 stop:1811 length:372 start_codon:yes stop_codon:yes gene_type:complete